MTKRPLTVQPDGKATILKRRVIKILRPQGRGFATVVVPIDRDRKLHSLHIWSIASDGHPDTLRDNEIAEVGDDEYGMLYVDLHARVARAPAADPGAVVAYEYERTIVPTCRNTPGTFRTASPPCTPSSSWSSRRTGTTLSPLATPSPPVRMNRRHHQPARARSLSLADRSRSRHRPRRCPHDAGLRGHGRPSRGPLLARPTAHR